MLSENLNLNKTLPREKITFKFSDKNAEIFINNLVIKSKNDSSQEFKITFEKQPTSLEKEEIYSSYVKYDNESETMLSIVQELKTYENLSEKEKLEKIMEILKKNIKYPTKKDVEKLKEDDPNLAEWIQDNLLTNNFPIIKLSDNFEKGYGICGNLSVAFLYLAEKIGFKGVIQNSNEIINIKRPDNNESLFKQRRVGETAPTHTWLEIQLKDESWVPIDPSVNLIGFDDKISYFKKANYTGIDLSSPVKINTNNDDLRCDLLIKYKAGENLAETICKVDKKKKINFNNLKNIFEPFTGNCKIEIEIPPNEELNIKNKIIEIKVLKPIDNVRKSIHSILGK